ncbi:hypothetical protein [Clostridium celatum]|uniref:hypothetical protein n=1 Tax=Clostridium celatum TaxID=36834 RepID=UPI00189A8959|nr:hypothetical protein [Clostridium celatum]
MIEAMEQQIINSINNRWRKNEKLRAEIDMDKISECFRMICSSRNSTLTLLLNIKNDGITEESEQALKNNILWIFDWITKDPIDGIYQKYNTTLLNKKMESKYKAEIKDIELFCSQFRIDLLNNTLEKLYKFHEICI